MEGDARKVLILKEQELRTLLQPSRDLVEQIADGFATLSAGGVDMPPIQHVTVGKTGDIDIKSAHVEGIDVVAVKVGAGFPGNRALGLPTSPAMMVAIDAQTGICRALLLDNAYLTDLRTGLAGAVAADALANTSPARVGMIGAGVQARHQLQAIALVREIASITIWNRSEERARELAREWQQTYGKEVTVARDIKQLCASSDLIVTTTMAREPVLEGRWLRPDTHVTAVGSDLPGKRELDGDALARASLVVADRLEQCRANGELQWIDEAFDSASCAELGDIISGKKPFARKPEDITIADLTGTGMQDTVIASAALATAGARKAGHWIDL
ncbi:hypothetical protein [Parasphingopyxis sp.]|uniref:hypothetical protein n=1 Tax=Parasphingopyxis sp. TaxID=1920299 RepID=UPI002601D8D0|nr:hypothetical protein [Parasphingopyxis sp.]